MLFRSGTSEVEVIPELASFPGETIPKTRYSGFYGTDLAERLAEAKPEKLIICGVCTDICVMHTAADARNRDYAVEVPADGVASFDLNAHRFALDHLERVLGVTLTNKPTEESFVPSVDVISGETADVLSGVDLDVRDGVALGLGQSPVELRLEHDWSLGVFMPCALDRTVELERLDDCVVVLGDDRPTGVDVLP